MTHPTPIENAETRSWCVTTADGFLLSVNLPEDVARESVGPAQDLPAYRSGIARPMMFAERAADSRRPEHDPIVSERMKALVNEWCEAKALRRDAGKLGALPALLTGLDALVAAKRAALDGYVSLLESRFGPAGSARCTCQWADDAGDAEVGPAPYIAEADAACPVHGRDADPGAWSIAIIPDAHGDGYGFLGLDGGGYGAPTLDETLTLARQMFPGADVQVQA